MKRFFIAAAAVAVLLGVAATAEDGEQVPVSFTMANHLELSVTKGSSVDFGEVSPTELPKTLREASKLRVESNAKWEIGVDKAVDTMPAGASESDVKDSLQVALSRSQGEGNARNIGVDYTLGESAAELPAGDYSIVVIYTATTVE